MATWPDERELGFRDQTVADRRAGFEPSSIFSPASSEASTNSGHIFRQRRDGGENQRRRPAEKNGDR
ncbi:MAG: hypothetical protein WKF84_12390 [Pyrinomonadaceae bacterium]